MEKVITRNLVAIARAYCKATGCSLTQASKDFYGNSYFFAKLNKGERSISVHQASIMLDAFRAKWPDRAQWPITLPVLMGRRPQK